MTTKNVSRHCQMSLKGSKIGFSWESVLHKKVSEGLWKFESWSRFIMSGQLLYWGFPDGSAGKESTCNVGDLSLIPGLGRSPGERNSYPLQYSGLENSVDRGAWQTTVQGVAKSRTWLSNLHRHSLIRYTVCVRFTHSIGCHFIELTIRKQLIP